jgi:CheY-like chemotaxis protein
MSKLWRAVTGLFFESDASGEEVEQPLSERPTVLVIDDDRLLLDAIREMLLEAGFNVLTSNTGVKGLNVLRYAPDKVQVVLLDFSMPEFSGGQTLPYIRQLCPHARVIAVTGLSPKALPASFRNGVDDLVQKPFTSANLLEHVRTGLPESKVADAVAA